MKRKSTRGRKADAVPRKELEAPKMGRLKAAATYFNGTLPAGTQLMLMQIERLSKTLRWVERATPAELRHVLQTFPAAEMEPTPLPAVPERDEIWRDVWRFSREPFKWLFRLSSASLVTVLALFIRAIEERDAEFFCAIAKRIESAPTSPTRKLARPVDPVRHVLATASFFDSRLGECPQPLERLDSILRAQGIKVDAKTIRRAAEDMGIRVANGKRGRPRKPDNS